MSLRYKLLLFFLIQHFIFLFIALLLSEFVIRPYNLEIEQKNANEKISQIKNVFQTEIKHLHLLNIDWAVWDDTYEYMKDKNLHFIKSNLPEDILETTNLSRIELFDVSGKNVIKQDNGQIDISTLLDNNSLLRKKYSLWENKKGLKGMYGIMQFKQQFAFISLHPILSGDGKGLSRGTLLMLRLVDSKMIENINKSTNSKILLLGLDGLSSIKISKQKDIVSEKIDLETLKVSSYLVSPDKKRSIIIEIRLKREFVMESEKLILFLFLFGGILGFISFIISYVLLRREVVKPLISLGEHIEKIRIDESFIASDLAYREDEIGLLAKEFNTLLSKIDETNKTLARVARVDALTGLANRLDLEERFEDEKRQSCRENQEISILMLDIDYFKKYNDTYGHVKGDSVLGWTAQAIKESVLRPRDYVARYGGEEFILILPQTTVAGSVAVAKRIIESIKELKIEHSSSLLDEKIITVSIGCITLVAHKGETQEFIINLADEALYIAKEKGRNQFHLYERNNS